MGSSTKRLVSRAYARIYDVVARIPRGRVMTYGQVAVLAGLPRAARVVGYALRAGLSKRPLPWQRVMGQKRKGAACITIRDPIGAALQRRLLEKEGIVFSQAGMVDLGTFGAFPGELPKARQSRQ
ncbi:MAG: MGMT family protein [Deltaproteobacteria bacterium]|nr:MGMT family protein [Deltaproteobacteria bacterium]